MVFAEHAVSNPIMVQGGGGMNNAGSVTSPTENSLCTQIIANVLGSSPGSLTRRDPARYVSSIHLTILEACLISNHCEVLWKVER